MKLSRTLKYFYLKIFLRSFYSMKMALYYFYGNIALFLALRGINLPGLKKYKSSMPQKSQEVFERKLLVFEIKGERYSFRYGPLWFRKYLEQALFVFDRNKYIFLVAFKIILVLFVVLIPVVLFILFRGVLPVPQRVPSIQIIEKLSPTSYLRTDWPYTKLFGSSQQPIKNNEFLTNEKVKNLSAKYGILMSLSKEQDSVSGLIDFGIGNYPSHLNLMQGFLVEENKPYSIPLLRNYENIETKSPSFELRLKVFLFPSLNSNRHQCLLTLFDENHHQFFSKVYITPEEGDFQKKNGIHESFVQYFAPSLLSTSDKIENIKIPLNVLPKKLFAHSLEKEKNYGNKIEVENNCLFALGDFSVEHKTTAPLKRRGVIFVVVDSLRSESANDKQLMPHLNDFVQDHSIEFVEHRAQSNQSFSSMVSLLTSRYQREFGATPFSLIKNTKERSGHNQFLFSRLPMKLEELGYRVGAIGWLSLFSDILGGDFDLGFHNAILMESSPYDTRQITEKSATWLREYGNAPFFLFLHYNTLHSPYKPPFSYINLPQFLKNPLGLNPRFQLYNGVARYWDDEFYKLIEKLKDLGIYNDVDIVVTSSSGVQLKDAPWEYLNGVKEGTTGASTKNGMTLLDEEIKVPLIYRVAHYPKNGLEKISIPTSHLDLFPTFYRFLGGKNIESTWKGLDLSPLLEADSNGFVDKVTKSRKFLYFDAENYAGVLYWGFNSTSQAFKYIRQFEEDDAYLYLRHGPWKTHLHWLQPEIFTQVNFKSHKEKWIPNIESPALRELRNIYNQSAPVEKIIRLTSKYSGFFQVKIIVDFPNKNQQKITLEEMVPHLPTHLTLANVKEAKTQISFTILGQTMQNDAIEIYPKHGVIKNIIFDKQISPLVCENGNKVDTELVAFLLRKSICASYAPADPIVEGNYLAKEKPVVVQRILANEPLFSLDKAVLNESLLKALREWGYAKQE